MRRFELFILLAIMLLALLPGAAVASNFEDCLCWDMATDSWCGGTDFYRSPCRDWVRDAFLWTIPAVLLTLFFFFFPFVFFCARCCCNCCGGKNPSDGICCPTERIAIDPITGQQILQIKTYSTRSIFLTKFFFCMAFGFWIYFSVGVYHINDQAHSALHKTIERTQFEIDYLASDVNMTYYQLQVVAANGGSSFVGSSLLQQLASAKSKFSVVQYHTRMVVDNITKAEDDQGWGRNEDAYRIPSFPMTILLIAFIMMLCNCHNGFISVLAGLFSWLAVFVVVCFTLHAIIAQGASAACDNYNDTVVPLLLDIAVSKGGCGVPSVVASFDEAAKFYIPHACGQGTPSQLYGNMLGLCGDYFNCPVSGSGLQGLCNTSFNWPQAATTVMSVFTDGVAKAASGCVECNVTMCAKECSDPSARAAAAQFAQFAESFGSPMAYVFGTAYSDYVNCTALGEALEYKGPIHNALCTSFSTDFTNVAILFLELTITCIPCLVLLVVGAKRFQKMRKANGEAVSFSQPQDFVYGVLVTSPEERAIVGSPILGTPVVPNEKRAAGESEPLLLNREHSMQQVTGDKAIQQQ